MTDDVIRPHSKVKLRGFVLTLYTLSMFFTFRTKMSLDSESGFIGVKHECYFTHLIDVDHLRILLAHYVAATQTAKL